MTGRLAVAIIAFAGLGFATFSGAATAVPEQVIPESLETGSPTFMAGAGTAFPGQQPSTGGGTGQSGSLAPGGSSYTGGGNAYDRMMAQTYGQTAANTAQQLGLNPNALAGFGVLESGFQNVGTANGSSSATGPWQITSGTWNDYVTRNNLPYTAADRNNPEAQAVVASYILKDYSSQVSSAIQAPATVQQTYGAWVFGPAGGSRIAAATDPSSPLSNYVSATALSNNNMTGMTVAQFYSRVGAKIGDVATQKVGA